MKINIKILAEAITGLENYMLPIETAEGVRYLYNSLYLPMANGESILLHDIDLNAFSLEDVCEMESYYDNTICYKNSSAYSLSQTLKALPPAAFKSSFI